MYVTPDDESREGAVFEVRQVEGGGVCLMEDRLGGNSVKTRVG